MFTIVTFILYIEVLYEEETKSSVLEKLKKVLTLNIIKVQFSVIYSVLVCPSHRPPLYL